MTEAPGFSLVVVQHAAPEKDLTQRTLRLDTEGHREDWDWRSKLRHYKRVPECASMQDESDEGHEHAEAA